MGILAIDPGTMHTISMHTRTVLSTRARQCRARACARASPVGGNRKPGSVVVGVAVCIRWWWESPARWSFKRPPRRGPNPPPACSSTVTRPGLGGLRQSHPRNRGDLTVPVHAEHCYHSRYRCAACRWRQQRVVRRRARPVLGRARLALGAPAGAQCYSSFSSSRRAGLAVSSRRCSRLSSSFSFFSSSSFSSCSSSWSSMSSPLPLVATAVAVVHCCPACATTRATIRATVCLIVYMARAGANLASCRRIHCATCEGSVAYSAALDTSMTS
jgi:hypothetical protein